MRPLAGAAILVTAFATATQVQETWVAVATDDGPNFGYAVGMAPREAAEMTSLGECAGPTREAAQQTAWNDCSRRVPSNSCTVRVAQCFEKSTAIRARVSLDANLERLLENLGVIIGIAVAVAVAVFFGTRRATQTQRLQAAAIGLVVAGAVAAVAMYGLKAMRDSSEDISAVDSAMASAHALPMVGVVLDDVPGAQDRLREALREEIRQPTTQGPSRPLKLMSELRVAYIVPALKAADEASAAAAIDARATLLKTLKDSDLVVCKEFAVTGIQRSDKLDATGQKLMSDLLAALEKAYRSGRAAKAAGTTAPAVASDAEARALLTEAGFQPADFDRLSRLARLPNEAACDLALKVNDAPQKVPADKRGALLRYLLTVQ